MKRGAIVAGLAAMWMALGCGTDVNLGNRPQFSTGTTVLTVLTYDGITAAPLPGVAMKLRIGPNEIAATVKDNAYTFNDVPNGTWPVVATLANYLDFVGTTGAINNTGTPAAPVYVVNTLALFPTNSVDNDYTVKVYDDKGTPVTGGKLVMTMSTAPSPVFDQSLTTPIAGSYGFKPTVIVADLAAGLYTVPKAQLVYGASYMVDVYGAKNAAGAFVIPPAPAKTVNPYKEYQQANIFCTTLVTVPVIVFMGNDPTDYNTNPKTYASPSAVFKFATPIEVCNASASSDFYSIVDNLKADGTPGTTTKPAATVPPTANVTFATSEGDMTLSVTPKFGSSDTAGDLSVMFDVSPIKVRVKGTTDCKNLYGAGGACLRSDAAACSNATAAKFWIYHH